MAGTRVDPDDKAKRNARERKNYRRAADLSTEDLAARRAAKAKAQREYITRHREEYNAKRRVYQRSKMQELRDRVLDALGARCLQCGHDDRRVLQIDHIDGGGRARRAEGGSQTYYRTMMNRLDQVQLLCANCHMIKSYRPA